MIEIAVGGGFDAERTYQNRLEDQRIKAERKETRDALSPEERRILDHYRSLRKQWNGTKAGLFMHLARRWKRPIRSIRKIVGK